MDELVDLAEAAERLGLAPTTLKMYRYGSTNNFGRFNVGMPDADYTIGNKPVWRLSTLDEWCRTQQRGRYNPRHPEYGEVTK